MVIALFILFLLSITLITFIIENDIVSSGATYGLMLWYQNVLPLLLPFILISSIIEEKIKNMDTTSNKKAICATVFLGLLCGYPIGAKTTANFVKNHIYSKKTGNMLLPLCNNISPMFLSGYIVHTILKDNISFCNVIFLIFSPYIFYLILMLIINHFCSSAATIRTKNTQKKAIHTSNTDLVENAITQITYVGFYIMLCSIAIELVLSMDFISNSYKDIIAGILEITRGSNNLATSSTFSDNIKTALIIAITSFGGISSILQTGKVIQKSGLSLLYYVVIKLICSIASFWLTLLFI